MGDRESIFCLLEGARCLRVVACDPFTGTIRKVYNCQSSDVEGGASCITHLSNNYLLCALQKKPILCVWNLNKVKGVCRLSCVEVVGNDLSKVDIPGTTYSLISIQRIC